MLVKAKVSFAGKISMIRGKTRDIADEEVANDLLRAGYVELIEPAEQPNNGEGTDVPNEQLNEGKNADSEGDKPKRKRKKDEGK